MKRIVFLVLFAVLRCHGDNILVRFVEKDLNDDESAYFSLIKTAMSPTKNIPIAEYIARQAFIQFGLQKEFDHGMEIEVSSADLPCTKIDESEISLPSVDLVVYDDFKSSLIPSQKSICKKLVFKLAQTYSCQIMYQPQHDHQD